MLHLAVTLFSGASGHKMGRAERARAWGWAPAWDPVGPVDLEFWKQVKAG